MWIYIFALYVGLTSAIPLTTRIRSHRQAAPPQVQSSQNQTPIPIISHTEVVGADGTFNFSYETGNGIKVQESGFIKQDPNVQSRSNVEGDEDNSVIQVIQGSYSYTAPDGQLISLRYIADENGFQPEGDHIPTAPPVPGAIQRSLALQDQDAAASPQDVQNPAAFVQSNYYKQQ